MAKTRKTNNKAKKQEGLRMTPSMKEKYAQLFIDALAAMEKSDWQRPWVRPHAWAPCNLYRRSKPYRGVNAFLLNMLMDLQGWTTPAFVTKTQIKNEDGELKYKNLEVNFTLEMGDDGMPVFGDDGLPVMLFEKRFPVIFFKPIHKDDDGNVIGDEDWNTMSFDEQREAHTYFYQSKYYVYNIDQTNFPTLYPEDYGQLSQLPEHDYEQGAVDETLERMIMLGEWRCPIRFGGQQALYSPSEDFIRLPDRKQFLGDSEFYQTAIHEMAHSTGPELGRDVANVFGTPDYAEEEFVAELTSACVCSMLGIGKLLDPNHIAYVESWRKALRTQMNFIPIVMDRVMRAVNYFMKRYDEVARKSATPLLTAA